MGHLCGERLDEREPLDLPRRCLLPPPLFQLGVALRIGEGDGGVVGDGPEKVHVLGGEEGPAATTRDAQEREEATTELDGEGQDLALREHGARRDLERPLHRT